MTQTWFISDAHFQHSKILEYSSRPFRDIDHMNETIVKNWNERVQKDDTVYFLGDFCFQYKDGFKAQDWINRLNGKIIFVKGNHDEAIIKTDIHSIVLNRFGRNFYLVHDPLDGEPGMINICGHVHNLFKFATINNIDYINVGVDVNNYSPICFSELMKQYNLWKKGKINTFGK